VARLSLSRGVQRDGPRTGATGFFLHPKPAYPVLMLTETVAHQFAEHWIHAWNSRDLDQILQHYDDEVVFTSPVVVRILNDPSGTVRGKSALRDYFARGLAAYPQLSFQLLDVLWGLCSIVLYYINQNGTKTAEFMQLNDRQKITRVVANYNA
jgi:hypothetical protein